MNSVSDMAKRVLYLGCGSPVEDPVLTTIARSLVAVRFPHVVLAFHGFLLFGT